MFSVDQIIKYFLGKSIFLNKIILKLNIFPKKIYGLKYLRNLNLIDSEFDAEDRLVQYVNYAIQNSKFYSKFKLIKSIDEFKNIIPLIDKNDFFKSQNSFYNKNFDISKFVYATTGGTTGKPMQLHLPKNRHSYELPVVHNIWIKFGWDYQTRGVIRNHKLSSNQIYKVNPFTKEIIFDAFRIDDKYVLQIYYELKKQNIKFLQCYPSSAYLFCKICHKLKLDLSFIKAIFTSSEPLLKFQRNFIENVVNIKISNFYGHTEKLIIAGDCYESSNLHFESTYGFCELIDNEGNTINEVGERGELVATGFNNKGLFLLRFKTGDYAEYVGNHCDKCGKKALIIKNILGHRNENLIFKIDGTYITTTALNLHGKLYDYIDGLQYIQNIKGKLIIKIIKNKNFTDSAHKLYLNHFTISLENKCEVEIEYVNKLDKLKNGKFPILISTIKQK